MASMSVKSVVPIRHNYIMYGNLPIALKMTFSHTNNNISLKTLFKVELPTVCIFRVDIEQYCAKKNSGWSFKFKIYKNNIYCIQYNQSPDSLKS